MLYFLLTTDLLRATYQVIKYVPLVDMNGDQGLIFDSFKLSQFLCCLFNESVEQVQEALVGGWHDFLVVTSVVEGLLSIPCPDHLDP